MKKFVPNSFISSNLIPKEGFIEKRKNVNQSDTQNEQLQQKWWLSQDLDYSPDICIPFISMEDCNELKKNKILIDVRPFTSSQYHMFKIENNEDNKYNNFLDCHVKNSYYMADTVSLLEILNQKRQNNNAAYEKDLEKLQKIS